MEKSSIIIKTERACVVDRYSETEIQACEIKIGKGKRLNTHLKNTVSAVSKEVQYDEYAKRLLGHKSILAHILIHTVEEFREMDPNEVVAYIEGEPRIGIVPVDPGFTNARDEASQIVGLNTENAEILEGMVRFDIIFYVRMRDGLSQMIINVEAQKGKPTKYKLLNRAIFYAGRLVSSQKERDFVKTNYDDLKKVHTIWICMNQSENSVDYYQLANQKVLGSCEWEGKQDLLNIVLIGLTKSLPTKDKKYELHRLLVALLSEQMTSEEKLEIIELEYDVPVEESLKEEMNEMCNLGEGLVERTEEKVLAEVVMNMYRSQFSLQQISLAINKSIEEVQRIIEEKSLVLA